VLPNVLLFNGSLLIASLVQVIVRLLGRAPLLWFGLLQQLRWHHLLFLEAPAPQLAFEALRRQTRRHDVSRTVFVSSDVSCGALHAIEFNQGI